ncbi:MAG: metallophosphoesterase [Flavobacteriales bacterium]|nr:metallophosphoesterase [Flavobacteriales bacterium]
MKTLRILAVNLLFIISGAIYAQDSLEFTMILLGDAGDYKKPGAISNFDLARKAIVEPSKTAVGFLGDNIYPAGLADVSDSIDRSDGEMKLAKQLDIAKGLCPAYIVPGNHDWNHWSAGGKDAAVRAERYIESYGEDLYQAPSLGCPGPEVHQLSEDVVFMAIDSQWWLHEWKKEPNIHDNCTITSREAFLKALEDSVLKYKEKQIVLGMHHPVYTKGPHGGRYTFKEHIFPLTMFKKNLLVPLPVLGSIAIVLRASGASRQDINHPLNKRLMKAVKRIVQSHDRMVVVSGHEHSLQHFYQDGRHFIVSGGGCKHTHLGKSKKLLYGRSCVGYAKLKFYKNSTYLEFYTQEFGSGSVPIYTGFLF